VTACTRDLDSPAGGVDRLDEVQHGLVADLRHNDVS
jgi:hypothetical protein